MLSIRRGRQEWIRSKWLTKKPKHFLKGKKIPVIMRLPLPCISLRFSCRFWGVIARLTLHLRGVPEALFQWLVLFGRVRSILTFYPWTSCLFCLVQLQTALSGGEEWGKLTSAVSYESYIINVYTIWTEPSNQ